MHIPEETLISEIGGLKFMHIQNVSDITKFVSELVIGM